MRRQLETPLQQGSAEEEKPGRKRKTGKPRDAAEKAASQEPE